MTHIMFSIPYLPKMTNQLLRRHWSFIMKEKDLWHGLVREKVLSHKRAFGDFEPFKTVRIEFMRASTQEPDWDGLVSGFKFVTDGLVKAGVMIDDTPSVIKSADYKWIKCSKKEQGIFVCVWDFEKV